MLLIRDIQVSTNTYLKPPLSSELGTRIVSNGILLLQRLGLEDFTFKKLAEEIASSEASIYRYFANKHMFFVFISNLYWTWLEKQIREMAYKIYDPETRLQHAIDIIVSPEKLDDTSDFPVLELHQIVLSEGPKAYLIKGVDEENKEGTFRAYKSLCQSLADIINILNPAYKYAHSLSSTVIEAAHAQLFFSAHLPRLTDIQENDREELKTFLNEIIIRSISPS